MEKHHIVIDAWNCNSSGLNDKLFIERFLKQLAERTKVNILHGPVVINRKEGILGLTGFLISESSHITLHSFTVSKEITLEIYSYKKLDTYKLKDYIISYFDIDLSALKIINFSNLPEENIECEEPRCTRKATKVWGGRKVCCDHYDEYRDKETAPSDTSNYW